MMNENSDTKASRKRTKTGCLTCRQRRIKCGEERPTCQNCIKSKRDCQGYNQRVIFKEPLNAFRPPASFSRLATAAPRSQQQQGQFQQYEPQLGHSSFFQNGQGSQRTTPRSSPPNFVGAQVREIPPMTTIRSQNSSHQQGSHSYQPESSSSTSESSPEATVPLTPSSLAQDDIGYQLDRFEGPQLPEAIQTRLSQELESHFDYNAKVRPPKHEHNFLDEHLVSSAGWNSEQSSSDAFHQSYHGNPNDAFPPHGVAHELNEDQYYACYHQEQREAHQNMPSGESQQSSYSPHSANQADASQFHETNWQESIPFRPGLGLDHRQDDPYDVNNISPTVMYQYSPHIEAEFQDVQQKHAELGSALRDNPNWSIRSVSTYLDDLDDSNSLASYQPSSSPVPLEDPMTARIFLHFVNVTGQNISMYERHPADPALMFSGRPVPHHNQHIWSYTMPTLALTNPGLLHAILAISSLHMAKLQQTSTIPSLKHYHIALRRIAKGLNSPRRGYPSILAANMLLGFYEVMSADHQKWTSHLLGAKQLLKEVNFAEKTKEIKAIRKRKKAQHFNHLAEWEPQQQTDFDEIDEGFVSLITGENLGDEDFGNVLDEETTRNHIHTERDIEMYENFRDLFWWFCKQDVYQSILSGNKLFLEYKHWTDCPPRAPIGRWEASYGTFDHVILLLGRVANFASKDLARKKRMMQSSGGVWRPAPEMAMPGPPPGQSHPPRPPPVPPFPGMMPTGGPTTLPMGFTASPEPPESIEDDNSLEIQTNLAIQEWNDIQNAFNILTTRLSPDFRPTIYANTIETPFGPAYQFKSYAMAGIWMNYYMGLIVHARSHPHMPPAAQMAAGIAANQTKTWAQELGRICGGIVTPESASDLTTLHGSAMIECSVPMFTAAVQYQEPEEREWIVKKLREIARLTGWQIADVIASGCEGAWMKAAENARGRPYKRAEGEVGAGADRPRCLSSDKGGMYWGFDGNRVAEVRGNDIRGVNGGDRDRRAIFLSG